ncbi:hypothetical protein BIW11_10281, partial [Tropilaelaps mercedesae]
LYTKLLASVVFTAVCYYLQGSTASFACCAGFILSIHFANLRRRCIVVQHILVVSLSTATTINEDAVSNEAELSIGVILIFILVMSEFLSSAQCVTIFGSIFFNPIWSNFTETRRASLNGMTHLFIQGLLVHSVSPIFMCWILSGGNLYPDNDFQRLLVRIALIKCYRE